MMARLAGLLALVCAAAWMQPGTASGMCCTCQDCSGAAFCVDGIQTADICAGFCASVGCTARTFDGADACAGGCDGAPIAPTATPPSTATASATRTPTASATVTETATATPTDTATELPTATPTDTATEPPTATPTEGDTATPSATPSASATATVTETATETATPEDTATPSETPTPSATGTETETPTVTATPSDTDTPSATPTITETPTVTPTPALGGQVRYYANDAPVADVEVALLGSMPASTTTGADGRYGFADAGSGMLSIRPSKDGDVEDAITSLDASFVLQYVADLIELTPDQLLAGDVTGDGTLSTLDASLILQFQVGLIDRFPVAEAAVCDSDWIFRPVPDDAPNQTVVPPMVAGMVCQEGEIAFDPFAPPVAGQDFLGILFGDVTGNWSP